MSLKEIARKTGTSISTVSRVLNHPDYSCKDPALSDAIWQAAKDLHYLPNSAARELRMGISPVESPFMTDIFLTRFESMEQDHFFLELFQCIKEELLRQQCLLGDMLNPMDILALGEMISRKKDTGLIILGKCPEELLPRLKKRYRYLVGIDRNPTDFLYDEVICNGATAAQMAMEHLISLGHQNIAYIGDCTYEARYTGYYQSHLSHNLPINHANIHPTRQTEEEGFQIMKQILSAKDRPTAVFCANDSTALGVLRAIRQSKKRGYLPSVISIDNISAAERTNPMLTTIDIPKKEMSHLALSLLLDQRTGQHSQPVRTELPCRLVVRESCHLI